MFIISPTKEAAKLQFLGTKRFEISESLCVKKCIIKVGLINTYSIHVWYMYLDLVDLIGNE